MYFVISMVYSKFIFMKFKIFINFNLLKKRYFFIKIFDIFVK